MGDKYKNWIDAVSLSLAISLCKSLGVSNSKHGQQRTNSTFRSNTSVLGPWIDIDIHDC